MKIAPKYTKYANRGVQILLAMLSICIVDLSSPRYTEGQLHLIYCAHMTETSTATLILSNISTNMFCHLGELTL